MDLHMPYRISTEPEPYMASGNCSDHRQQQGLSNIGYNGHQHCILQHYICVNIAGKSWKITFLYLKRFFFVYLFYVLLAFFAYFQMAEERKGVEFHGRELVIIWESLGEEKV